MKIITRFFGEVEIQENRILSFPEGMPGFENLTKFVLLDLEDNQNLKCLQSIEDSSICLMMVIPWSCFENYEVDIPDSELEQLEVKDSNQVLIYNIITIREDQITANLVAPIIINANNNMGKQIILSDTKYSIRQEISCLY